MAPALPPPTTRSSSRLIQSSSHSAQAIATSTLSPLNLTASSSNTQNRNAPEIAPNHDASQEAEPSPRAPDAAVSGPQLAGNRQKASCHPKEKRVIALKRDVDVWRYKKGIRDSLPPIDDIRDIVGDMVDRYLPAFERYLRYLKGHVVRVATMCSGTEAPVLFLTEIAAALADRGKTFRFEHVFSAEIEPFKQAYIERNFHPKLLFRDITQFGIEEKPETAYGTRAELPKDVDLLVAGFSCVDFSNLNTNKKTLDDDGQSGQTAHAVLRYAKENRVPIVILENIANAPWTRLKELWEEGGYVTRHVKVDTKEYYLPHTRQRGYMICIFLTPRIKPEVAASILEKFEHNMKLWKRQASSPFHQFLLHPDDPRLPMALAEYNSRNANRINMSWVRYEARHLEYRLFNRFGSGKPVTGWKANGTSSMVEHGQSSWMRNEVDRVKDTLEIAFLRGAVRGYDIHSKCVVIDFSQGVDRQADTTPAGLIGCVTPSGIPYYTMRGGVITGVEALRLQGIPTDELSLTRESQRELHNMAGNAMSTTVVGAAILSGLFAAICTLRREPNQESSSSSTESTNKNVSNVDVANGSDVRDLSPHTQSSDEIMSDVDVANGSDVRDSSPHTQSSDEIMSDVDVANGSDVRDSSPHTQSSDEIMSDVDVANGSDVRDPSPHTQSRDDIVFDIDDTDGSQLYKTEIQVIAQDQDRALTLMALASKTVAQCLCEGLMRFANCDILICKGCKHQVCKKCRGKPRHDFEKTSLSARLSPFQFVWDIKQALPMCMVLAGFVLDLDLPDQIDLPLGAYFKTVRQSVQEMLHFTEIKRTRVWTVIYRSSLARLELQVSSFSCEWTYFALPDKTWPGNRKERKLLEDPVGRMTVNGEDLLKGQWEFRLPAPEDLDIVMSQKTTTRRVPSWWSKMKLPGFQSHKVPMDIAVSTRGTLPVIEGNYEYLPDCGTACSSLYVQRSNSEKPMYLFLDPEFYGDPEKDRFVFSSNPRRLVPGQTRFVAASIGENKKLTQWLLSSVAEQTFEGCIDQTWLKADAFLTFSTEIFSVALPGANFQLEQIQSLKDSGRCVGKWTPVFACIVPEVVTKRGAWKIGPWLEVTETWQHEVFTSIAWLTSRCATLGGRFDVRRYLSLEEIGKDCQKCAPRFPKTKWGRVGPVLQPYEDSSDAARYETAIKARPNGIVAFSRKDDLEQGHLLAGINVIPLAHLALEALSRALPSQITTSVTKDADDVDDIDDIDDAEPEVSWRLDTHYSTDDESLQEGFALLNNHDDPKMNHVFSYAIRDTEADPPPRLRPEQARSLHWMTSRENPNGEPFVEEETEEMVFSHLGWRLDAKATSKKRVLGGVVADGVGYGKTITTLALIESQGFPNLPVASDGKIPLKATLILVTAGTLPQWQSETEKFLGKKITILVIKDVLALKRLNVDEFQKAHVIIAPHALLTGPTYLNRLAEFAALPPPPPLTRSRAFTTWLRRTITNVENHLKEFAKFAGSSSRHLPKRYADDLFKRQQAAKIDKELLEEVPCKFQASNQADEDGKGGETDGGKAASKKRKRGEDAKKPAKQPQDPFCLNTANGIMDIKGPCLEFFKYNRIVIDEFTYLKSQDRISINALISKRKWLLSGTPPLEDFADVKRMANAIGVRLGRDDIDKQSMSPRNVRELQKEQTGFEKFCQYGEVRTRRWHYDRYLVAKAFLALCVRKNLPTIKIPPSTLVLKIVNLTTIERAIYTELEAWLVEKLMQAEKARNVKYMCDRDIRIHDALSVTKCGELGLLSAATCLRPDANGSFDGTRSDFELIVKTRNKHLSSQSGLNRAITSILVYAEALYRICGDASVHYANWIKTIESKNYKDRQAGDAIMRMRSAVAPSRLDTDALIIKTIRYLKHTIYCEKEGIARRFSPKSMEDDYRITTKQQLWEALADPNSNKMVLLLRELTVLLSSLDTQYVNGLRACRYLETIGYLHGMVDVVRFDCGHPTDDHDGQIDGQMLSACGHTACSSCVVAGSRAFTHEAMQASTCATGAADAADPVVSDADDDDVPLCVVEGCNAQMTDIRPISELLVDEGAQNKVGGFQGSKIHEIVTLITDVIPPDAQIIVFVQDDCVMEMIETALDAKNVTNRAILEKHSRSARAGIWIQEFRLKCEGDNKIRVLLLNSANESCAGSNLQNASHVIFVSPFHATSDYDYMASETQCLGRASRQGQKKKVKLYRFLTLNTIDVDIVEARTSTKLVKHGNEGWALKAKDGLTSEDLARDWGTVIGREFLPDRLNGGDGDED